MVVANVTCALYSLLQLIEVDRGHLWKILDGWAGSLILLSGFFEAYELLIKEKESGSLVQVHRKTLNSERPERP